MIPFRNWLEIQGRINQGNIFYYPVSPSQKPQAPTDETGTLSLGWKRLHTHHLKIPKVITHMSYHTSTLEILDTIIITLVLVPTERHTKPLDLFFTLGTAEIQSSGFFQSSNPNEILFLTNYHSQKSKSYRHF
jgi:hypothetical protein